MKQCRIIDFTVTLRNRAFDGPSSIGQMPYHFHLPALFA
jgi:hypothetical protein